MVKKPDIKEGFVDKEGQDGMTPNTVRRLFGIETSGMNPESRRAIESLVEAHAIAKTELARTTRDQIRLAIELGKTKGELEETKAELERAETSDKMTGLKNKAYLEERMNEEIAGAERHRKPLSLLFLDIDHFKGINDTFGHEAGDVAIRKLAEIMKETVRTEDVACRWGGEEFAIILPDTDELGAMKLAERLRAKVEAAKITHDGQDIAFTISIGSASLSDNQTVDEMTREADEAMYTAKRSGRNRVMSARQVAEEQEKDRRLATSKLPETLKGSMEENPPATVKSA